MIERAAARSIQRPAGRWIRLPSSPGVAISPRRCLSSDRQSETELESRGAHHADSKPVENSSTGFCRGATRLKPFSAGFFSLRHHEIQARHAAQQLTAAPSLSITLTLSGERAHVFRAVCAADNETPVKHLAKLIDSDRHCYFEARASDMEKGEAMTDEIARQENATSPPLKRIAKRKRPPALTEKMIESGADLSAFMSNGRAVPALRESEVRA